MGYQVKVLVGALAEVYRLEQSTLSRGEIGRPGQAGFVQRGARGASRSSPRFALPSFSTEEEDDNDDDDDDEVDFPNQSNVQGRRQSVQGGNQPWQPIAAKNLNSIRAPRRGRSGFSEIAAWNRSARQGAWKRNEERLDGQT